MQLQSFAPAGKIKKTYPFSQKKVSSNNKTLHKEKKNPISHENTNTDSLLLQDLGNAKKDIETLLLHLDYQTDPDMIDCYIYQLKGAYMRYKFILRQIQQTGQFAER